MNRCDKWQKGSLTSCLTGSKKCNCSPIKTNVCGSTHVCFYRLGYAPIAEVASQRWERILFTDEKLLTVEQTHNHQNDRSWSAEAPGTSAIVEHRQNPQSVMVWGRICASGKTPLVFVDQGVKINQEVYRRDIIETVVLLWAQQHFGDVNWTFQQDSAPAHKSKTTQYWCRTHFPDFIASSEWPPYSPDLNPIDYSVWSILEARACATRFISLESLKQSLRREWD